MLADRRRGLAKTVSAQAVNRWISSLNNVDAATFKTGLSPEGARAAWQTTLSALDAKSVERALRTPTSVPKTACFVAARTVFTAPIEWLAMWLGRGIQVTLKHPVGAPGAALVFAQTAREAGLHLTITADHEAIHGSEVVLAMGSDESISAIRSTLGADQQFIGLGHAFSAAWVDRTRLPADKLVPADFQDAWGSIAADAALYDGRGCLSPQVVFTDLPVDEAIALLSAAMIRAERVWPRGIVSPAEYAAIRTRQSYAQVLGQVAEGEQWQIHALPGAQFKPASLPRCVALVSCQKHQAELHLKSWRRWLSTSAGLFVPPARTCRVGRMQRPPLFRKHNGVEVSTGGLPLKLR
ncbi:MAG: hypothetical protein GWP91_25420 [Rhodobacterales bacterium]|nr:hypothetical protein [Rhodobacterales bacterium]